MSDVSCTRNIENVPMTIDEMSENIPVCEEGAYEMTLYLAVFVSGVFIGILCGWIVTMVYFILKEQAK